MGIMVSTPLVFKTFSTSSLGPKITILPPRPLMARAGATSARSPIDPRKETFCKSTITAFLVPAITFMRISTAAAPSMSMRPSKMTLVIPPSSSSVEIGISSAPYPIQSNREKAHEDLGRAAQVTVQGESDDTPLNITGLLQRDFPSLQCQDDLRVGIEPLRHPRTRRAALRSQ